MSSFIEIKNKFFVWNVTIVIAIICGLFSSLFYKFIPITIALVIIFTCLVLLRKQFVLIFMIWISLQNFVIPLIYAHTSFSPFIWTLIISISVIVPAIISLLCITNMLKENGTVPKWVFMSFIYMFIILVCSSPYITKGGDLVSTVYYYRSLFMPLLFVIVGYYYSAGEKKQYRDLLRIISIISILGAIFAIIDSLFITIDFWRNVAGLGVYYTEVKHLGAEYILNGLPSNFFTLSGTTLLRRAISFYGDPLAAGYSMVIGLGAWLMLRLGIEEKNTKSNLVTIIIIFIIIIGISLTFTRAAYIMIASIICYLLFNSKDFRKMFPKIAYILIIGVLLYFGGSYINESIHGNNSSAIIHTNSVMSIFKLLSNPLGTGRFLETPEGTFQSILWTIGVMPVIAFVIWIWTIFPDKHTLAGNIGRGIIWAFIISAFISYQIMGTSCSFGWMMIGGLLSMQSTNKIVFSKSEVSPIKGADLLAKLKNK